MIKKYIYKDNFFYREKTKHGKLLFLKLDPKRIACLTATGWTIITYVDNLTPCIIILNIYVLLKNICNILYD